MAKNTTPATLHTTSEAALAAKVGRQKVYLLVQGDVTRYAAAGTAAKAALAAYVEAGGKVEQLSKSPRVRTADAALAVVNALPEEERTALLKLLKAKR